MVKVVAHPETGAVITVSKNNSQYGTIRLDSENVSLEGKFMNKSKRTAFIRGKVEDLQSLGYKAGQTLGGKIMKKESFSPFYEGQRPKINPSNGEIILTNGEETFLDYTYTSDANALDIWVGSTNKVEEVVNALAEQAI